VLHTQLLVLLVVHDGAKRPMLSDSPIDELVITAGTGELLTPNPLIGAVETVVDVLGCDLGLVALNSDIDLRPRRRREHPLTYQKHARRMIAHTNSDCLAPTLVLYVVVLCTLSQQISPTTVCAVHWLI